MAASRPRLDWLTEARSALNADPAFRKLGSADFALGLVVGDQARIVTFEAFEIAAVTEADPADLRDADLVVEMAPKAWNAYLRERAKGKAGTLMALDLSGSVVRSGNPLKGLILERYNLSVQALLDKGAALTAAS